LALSAIFAWYLLSLPAERYNSKKPGESNLFYDQINDALNISVFPFQIKYTVEEIENGRWGCK
jgi:hypothetical protein